MTRVLASPNHPAGETGADPAVTRQVVARFEAESQALSFRPDGQRIASAGFDGTVKVWDLSPPDGLVLPGPEIKIRWARFSGDGRRVVAPTLDGGVVVWDSDTGRQLVTLRHQDNHCNAAVLSPDGRRVAAAGSMAGEANGVLDTPLRPMVLLWELATGRLMATLPCRGEVMDRPCMAFSPDGARVVTGSEDGGVQVWDFATGKELLTLVGHNATITYAGFYPDGTRIITSSYDETTRIWDASTGRELFLLKSIKGPANWRWGTVHCATFSTRTGQLVTGHDDGTVRLWQADTGLEIGILQCGRGQAHARVGLTSDERRIITQGFSDGTVRFWDRTNSKEVLALKVGDSGNFHLSPDGQALRVLCPIPEDAGNLPATERAGNSLLIRTWEAATEAQVDRWQREELQAAE